MNEPGKITASHLSRTAVIYVRQSTLIQVERNTESTGFAQVCALPATFVSVPSGLTRSTSLEKVVAKE